ncbi:MAG TPA: PEP-CTERM system TPR-repeat protein PrsT, partial [Porticoccaceae bacterium]|nr:PEP-CTERM system TPR-repeat protein PrsT [Porticoccaceae bacterium]
LTAGEVQRATGYLDRGLSIAPNDPQLLYLKGEIGLSSGDIASAMTAFEKAQLDPETELIALLGQARGQLASGDPDTARSITSRVLEQSPNHPLANYLFGLAEFQTEHYDGARSAFEKVLMYNPDHLGSLQMLGAIQYNAGQYGLADTTLAKLLTLAPDNLIGRRLLTATRLRQDRVSDAIKTVQEIADTTDDVPLLLLGATAFQRAGNQDTAQQYLERAAALSPETPSIQARLGISHLLSGNTAQAIKEFESVGQVSEEFTGQSKALIAVSHLQNRDFDQALAIANEITEENPNSAFANNLAGSAHLGLSNIGAAKERFSKALAIDPQFTPAALNLARVAALEGDLQASEEQLLRILEYQPHHETALINLAQLAASRDDADALRGYLEKARAGSDDAVRARVALARYYLRTGDSEAAMQVAREAVDANPDDVTAILSLAQASAALNQRETALTSLGGLQSGSVKDPALLTQAANLYRGLGENQLASTLLEDALELNKDYVPALMSIAQLEIREREFDTVRSRAQRIRELAPESPEGPAIEGDIEFLNQRYDAAVMKYREALAKQSTPTLAIKLFRALRLNGQTDQGIEELEQWIGANPESQEVIFVLATALMQENRLKESADQFNALLEQNPVHAAALNNLAWVYYQLRDNRSVSYAVRAPEAAPESAEVLDTAGWILLEAGDTDKGVTYLKQAHEKVPENPVVTYHYAAALAKTGKSGDALRMLEGLQKTDDVFDGLQDALALYNALKNELRR